MDKAEILNLLNEVREALEDHVDIRDGLDGRPLPNWAMSLQTRVDEAIEKLEREDA